MENLAIKLEGNQKELILRTGEAEKITHPKAIIIAGILAAPHQFLTGKEFDPKQCHIQIKKDIGVISLHILDTDPHSASTITGSLKKDSYFERWGINTEKRWTVSEFLKFLKMNKSFFVERGECDSMVASLQKWGVNVELVIKQHNDNSGNSLTMLERKVGEIDLKKKFKLRIPIFQGYSPQEFEVEIGFDPKANAVDLYLFSEDLYSLEISHRESLITSELSKFDDFPCSKVVLS